MVHSLLHRRFYFVDESCTDRLDIQLELLDYPPYPATEFSLTFKFDPLSRYFSLTESTAASVSTVGFGKRLVQGEF